MANNLQHNNRTGFSFIEILIVLAIVAGIATLVLQQSDTAIDRSLVQKFYVDIDELRTAAAQYKVQTGSYSGINMVALRDAGLLPDRFVYYDNGYPRIESGADDLSEDSNPLGEFWSLYEYTGGQSYVLETGLLPLGGEGVKVATQLSRHVNGVSGNCRGLTITGYVIESCREVGQAWPDGITTWQYRVQD